MKPIDVNVRNFRKRNAPHLTVPPRTTFSPTVLVKSPAASSPVSAVAVAPAGRFFNVEIAFCSPSNLSQDLSSISESPSDCSKQITIGHAEGAQSPVAVKAPRPAIRTSPKQSSLASPGGVHFSSSGQSAPFDTSDLEPRSGCFGFRKKRRRRYRIVPAMSSLSVALHMPAAAHREFVIRVQCEGVTESGIIAAVEGRVRDRHRHPSALVPTGERSHVVLGVSVGDCGQKFCTLFGHHRGAVCIVQVNLGQAWQALLAATGNVPTGRGGDGDVGRGGDRDVGRSGDGDVDAPWRAATEPRLGKAVLEREKFVTVPQSAVRIRMLTDGRSQPVLFDLRGDHVSSSAIPRKRTSLGDMFGRRRQRPLQLDTLQHMETYFLSVCQSWRAERSVYLYGSDQLLFVS
eukprot:Gregarina_sp_Poly_1__7914@NODE_450_length_8314_cov_212_020614_g368_i0_p4_GENE_NODE_450_length_8314_cov_212_020614_g368_i0NODE_450_length_8314_cov_212_020614_g368_i0_p4_ORF_typecomplete_len402_score50_62_NODE_450_length_8314_cov_212_020614_g368_i035934798